MQAAQQGGQVQRGNIGVGHHHRALLRQHRCQQRAGGGQQIFAHHHVIAGTGQRQRQPARRAEVEQRLQHLIGGLLRAIVAAIHDDVRLGIDRMAHRHQPLQHFLMVPPGQQWAVGTVGRRGAAAPAGGSAARC